MSLSIHEAISIALQLAAELIEMKTLPPKTFQPTKHPPLLTTPSLHTIPRHGKLGIKKLSSEKDSQKR